MWIGVPCSGVGIMYMQLQSVTLQFYHFHCNSSSVTKVHSGSELPAPGA